MKICKKCNQEKPPEAFGKDKKRDDNLQVYCKECRKKEKRISPEKRKEWEKKDRAVHPEKHQKLKEYKRNWYLKHEAPPRRERIDPKITIMWRRVLKSSLRRMGKSKEDKTINLLGYSASEFKNHIESLWTDGMCWENYGEWQIDHIIHVNLFPPDTPPRIVNSLVNLRPLWKTNRAINGVEYLGNLNRGKDYENRIRIDSRPFTLFIDIDGCLLNHFGKSSEQVSQFPIESLKGVKDKFNEWDSKSYKIILTTGRPESARKITEKQLHSLGLFWHMLIMDVGNGQRFLINDMKPHSKIPTAVAINLKRNQGLADVSIVTATICQALAEIYRINLPII